MHRSSANVIVVAVVGILAGGVLAGCTKPGATGDPVGSACSKVVGDAIDRVMREGMRAGATDGGKRVTPEVQQELNKLSGDAAASLTPLKNATIEACSEDKWPADVLRCVGSAAARSALDACEHALSVDQKQHLDELVAKSAKSVPAASPACERYAKLEIQCGKATDSDRPTILQFCAKARAGSSDTTLQWIALESTCAETAADCGAYAQCIDAKKHATVRK